MKKMLSKVLALTLVVALGLSLVGGAFAAEPQTGTFDLESSCFDYGQLISTVVINLDQPIGEATADEVADAFSVTVAGYSRNFYGWPIEGDFARDILTAEISEDGETITLNLDATQSGGGGMNSIIGTTDYADYSTGYEITLTEAVGDLTTDLTLTYSGNTTDPVADEWGAVARDDEGGTYAYRWYDPSEDYEMPETGYPIIVWLHGAGEWGSDNNKQLTANRVTAWGEAETQDLFGGAYVIAPQAYSGTEEGVNPDLKGWNGDSVIATIESLIAMVGEKTVDMDRIVIGGCSAGGAGTINVIKAYPDYFAAAFPICPAGTINDAKITESSVDLLDLPIYLIHSVDDGTVNISTSITTYNFLKGQGKTNIYLALFEHVWFEGLADTVEAMSGYGHWSWVYAHNDFAGEDKYWLDEYEYSDGVTYETTVPSELGYDSFKAWLADQVRPEGRTEPYYTLNRETCQFGEAITSVTVYNLPYIKATVSIEDYLATNPIVVTALDVADATTGELSDVVRTPIDYVIGEDRTSLTIEFGQGNAWAGESSITGVYTVTVGGEEITRGNDTADTDKFESVTYTVSEYTRGTEMSARYYVPDSETYEEPEDGYPLVVWLHGGGETGTDNRIQIAANDVPNWTEEDAQEIFQGAYILAPQNHAGAGVGAPQATKDLIDQFVEEMGNIDINRIYVGGCSYGGIATWEMLRNFPTFFAAGFPICCGPTNGLSAHEANALNTTPIYMVTSTGDSSGIVSSMIDAYNDLVAAGSEVVHFAMFEHSEFVGGEYLSALGVYIDHWSWVYVHEDFDGLGDDLDGNNFIDTSIDGEYNNGAVVVKDGVLTYTYVSGTNEDGTDATTSISLNGKTERPSEIGEGYETFKTWMAAQENPNEYIVINKEVTAWGEVVSGISLILDTPLVDEESIKVTVTATVSDWTTGETSVEEIEREVLGFKATRDLKTIALDLGTGAAFDAATSVTFLGYEVEVDGRTITKIGGQQSDVDAFEALTFTTPAYTRGGSTLTTMNARAYTPDKEAYPMPENGYPLVVWLHGGGETGTDNRIQVAANDVPAWTETYTQDIFGGAYVLAPQNHASAGAGAPAATLDVILQFCEMMGDIDMTKIYVGGCSYGGAGTWTMLKTYPNFFAAGFPICAGVTLTEAEIESLVNTPIYMTASTGDSSGIVSGMINAHNALSAAGNENVHIALFEHSVMPGLEALVPMLDHWSWIYVHEDYDALGEDSDGVQFIDTTVDGEYNDGAIVVKDGTLTYTYTSGEETKTATLNGSTERPEDTGYATFKTWLAAQTNDFVSVFVDVTADTEYAEDIIALYEAGLTNGTSVNTYEPEATLTRAEFMTFLARATEQTVDNTADTGFSDVAINSWETGSIAWGVENGLIEGYGDGTFGPEDPITEEQVNLIIGRLIENVSGITAADGQLVADATSAPATRGLVASIIKAVADNYSAPSYYWW